MPMGIRRTLAFLLLLALALAFSCASAEEAGTLVLSGKLAKSVDKLNELYQRIDEALLADSTLTKVAFDTVPVDIDALALLTNRYPQLQFEYSISLLGRKTRSTSTTANLYPNQVHSEAGFQKLMKALRWLPELTELRALNSSFTFDQMEAMHALLPNMHVSCKLRVNKHYVRNNLSAFGTRHSYHSTRYTSDDMRALRYMDNLLALDIGHNGVTSLDFLYDLPELRILILADNQITDLTPIASLKHLVYLEIFKNPVTDLTPLAELTGLRDLNMTFCSVSDFSPLCSLQKLDRLWISENPVSDEQLRMLTEALPDCTINTTAGAIAPTAEGWRQGHPRYLQIVRIFNKSRYEELKY